MNGRNTTSTDISASCDAEKTELLHDGAGPAETCAAPVGVGTVLAGRFELVQLIGEGGMSHVFKAVDRRRVEAGARDPHLAVKVLTAKLPDQSRSLTIMHREASKLQALTHPNIVRVFDCDRDGQTVFMTMEHLEGTSLRRRMPKKPGDAAIPRDEALRVIAHVAEALDYAHHNRIVHGDLKPSNVYVTNADDVKVIDFGIARFLRRPQEADEPTFDWERDFGALTPPYASPEMHDGAEPDPRDDIYALASIAYELLVGDHPFARTAANKARESAMKVPASNRLREHEARALEHALHFDRKRRTRSARQFLDELRGERSRPPAGKVILIAGLGALALAAVLLGGRMLLKREPEVMVAPTTPLTAGSMFRDCPTCPVMRVLPPATFVQGSSSVAAPAFEKPAHSVTLSYLFAAGVNEVTVGEFTEFAQEYPRNRAGCETYDGEWRMSETAGWRNADAQQTAAHPVTCVSWQDAADYAAWLSLRTGHTYRLPTASEWEYLAGGDASATPWSDVADACAHANAADASATARFPGWNAFACNDRFVGVAPVGSFEPNAFGLVDTLGNAFEWVQDCWRDNYTDAPSDGSSIETANCREREARGGSWFTAPTFVRPNYRNRFDAEYRGSSLGFRLVREIDR